MKLLLIAFAACIAAANAISNFDDIGMYGGPLDVGRTDRGYGQGGYGGNRYNYGSSGGSSGGFGSSGFSNQGNSMRKDFGRQRNDFKAIVQSHSSGERGASQSGGFNNRGGTFNGYGNSGRSEYGSRNMG